MSSVRPTRILTVAALLLLCVACTKPATPMPPTSTPVEQAQATAVPPTAVPPAAVAPAPALNQAILILPCGVPKSDWKRPETQPAQTPW